MIRKEAKVAANFFTKREIERGITWELFLAIVAAGYMPDKRIYANDAPGRAAYEAALAAIIASKGFAVTLQGMSASDTKGDVVMNQIQVEYQRMTPGTIGASGAKEFFPNYNQDNPEQIDNYSLLHYPEHTKNVHYIVRGIANNPDRASVLEEIIYSALGIASDRFVYGRKSTGYPNYDATDGYFRLCHENADSFQYNGYFENLNFYKVEDVWLVQPEIEAEPYNPLTDLQGDFTSGLGVEP